MEGTVKFFDEGKGFGFITGSDGKDYYVHSSKIKEGVSITEGDKVSFKAVEGDKGLKAEEVEKASSKDVESDKEKPEENNNDDKKDDNSDNSDSDSRN